MQSYHTDASDKLISLDHPYYFGGQNFGAFRAVVDHHPLYLDGLAFKSNDSIYLLDIRRSSFYGINIRTKKNGTFPGYKVKEVIKTSDFFL